MRSLRLWLLATCVGAALAVGALVCSLVITRPVLAQSHPAVTKAIVDQWMSEFSNWGRWARTIKWVPSTSSPPPGAGRQPLW